MGQYHWYSHAHDNRTADLRSSAQSRAHSHNAPRSYSTRIEDFLFSLGTDSGGVHYRQYWKNIALNATSVNLTTPGQAAGTISIDTVSPYPANQQLGAANTCVAALP